MHPAKGECFAGKLGEGLRVEEGLLDEAIGHNSRDVGGG